jgi:nucleoside-diphosphate-sugar epimerase
MAKILVTGALGQIGSELVPTLQQRYGRENVVTLDMKPSPDQFSVTHEVAKLPDLPALEAVIKQHQIDTVYHLVSLLSATGEKDPTYTWHLNVQSLKDVLDLAVAHKLKVFWPSSIAAFGPTTPQDQTPQHTVLAPTTMYGVTKVAGELLCQYYFLKYGVDVRSVRYPGIISFEAEPGGGTTDYAVAIFYEVLKKGQYECYLKKDSMLPMMYMADAMNATLKLMEADPQKLTVHTSYNLAAISFTPEQLAAEIQKHLVLKITYQPDHRQAIADSWPNSIDDSVARQDWGWQHEYDLAKLTTTMLERLKHKLKLK